MAGVADNWELVARIAELAIDTAESVDGLQRIMAAGPFDPIATPLPPGEDPYSIQAGNAAAMALLHQHRPDLLPALRERFVARKAHLIAAGKIKPEPLPVENDKPANAIRKGRAA